MRKIDIANEIDNIKNQLVEKYRPEKIILFGSAAWGEGGEVRDLDFFIIKRDVPFYGGDRIEELYRIMDAHVAVDYIVYTPEEARERLALDDPFIKKIINEGKLLYG